jgi:hypothetical protein
MRRMPDAAPVAVRPTCALRTLGIGLALLSVAALPVRSATPPVPTAIHLDVERDGDRFRVTARADMAADPRVAWDTLTDYERLPEFVPSVTRTRVLAREARLGGERLTVEYSGTLKLWFFSVPTQVWLDVQHAPFTDVTARDSAKVPARVDGPPPSLKSFDGRYTLAVVGGGSAGAPRVRFDYSAQFELAEPLPPIIGPLFGTAAVRQTLREQFGAMVTEIERRSRARQGLQKGR